MTIASMMKISQKRLAANLTESLCALIYQALHLAKSLPFTDKSMKKGTLSVKIQTFRTRFYGQMLRKAAFVRKSSS